MNTPRVSICLPNLNTLPYLQERVDTIFQQTYPDWELVVSDNHSDDGAWPFFQDLARKDKRVMIGQAPRDGLYANWNNCLRRARGEYIYIATSDDAMAPDCIGKMVAALEKHTDCELAHCPLVMVDENGARITYQSWPEITMFGDGLGELVHKPHVRVAPYDGLLHLTGKHVCLSITQLLIRRSLFSRIGDFTNKWGSVSDFNWEMRAGLVANTVHVPETWATWRIHSKQATASVDGCSVEHYRKFEAMVQDAISACEPHLAPEVVAGLKSGLLDQTKDMRTYYAGLRQRRRRAQRLRFQFSQLFTGGARIRAQILGRMFGQPKWSAIAATEMQQWLKSRGICPLVPSGN